MAEPRLRVGGIGSPEGVALEDETGAEVLRVMGGVVDVSGPVTAPNINALREDADELQQEVEVLRDVVGLIGGADVSPQLLRQWAESEAYEPTAITRNAEGVVTSATVRWPDGSTGVMTATATNATWLTIDSYTITHDASGLTVTQPAVTRDPATGAVTNKPELTVS